VLAERLDEVISVMPAMWLKTGARGVWRQKPPLSAHWRPGRPAETLMWEVDLRSGATGSTTKAMPPRWPGNGDQRGWRPGAG